MNLLLFCILVELWLARRDKEAPAPKPPESPKPPKPPGWFARREARKEEERRQRRYIEYLKTPGAVPWEEAAKRRALAESVCLSAQFSAR